MKVVRAGFRHVAYIQTSSSAGFYAANFGLHPSQLGDVAAQMSDLYGFYRVTRLKFRVHIPVLTGEVTAMTLTEQTGAVAFTTQYDESSLPGGYDSMAQWPCYHMGNGRSGPIALTVPKNVLLGQSQPKWFRCTTTTTEEDNLYYQGLMMFATYTDQALSVIYRIWCEIEGDLEFCQPIEYTDRVTRSDTQLVPFVPRALTSQVQVDDEKIPAALDDDAGSFDGIPGPPGLRRFSRDVAPGGQLVHVQTTIPAVSEKRVARPRRVTVVSLPP